MHVVTVRSADKDSIAQAALDLAEASYRAGLAAARGYKDDAARYNREALLAMGRLLAPGGVSDPGGGR